MFNVNFFLKLLLLISFSFCYLNLGHDGGGFIFQAEHDLLVDFDGLKSLHSDPFFIAVCVGQLLVCISLFVTSNAWLMIAGILLLSVIEIFALILGFITGNLGAITSTIPFFIIAVLLFSRRRIVQ